MRKVFIVLVLVMLAGVSLPSVSLAQEDTGSTDSDTSVNSEQDDSTDIKSDKAAARQARIDAIKQRIADRLSDKEERRVAGLCVAAQNRIANLKSSMEKATENRSTRYSEISDKLSSLSLKLQEASVDTSQLDSALAEMNVKAANLINSIESYIVVLSDLAEMDCEDDPSGFKVVLTDLRDIRKSLIEQSKELKKYVIEDVRKILNSLKGQLETASEETESTE